MKAPRTLLAAATALLFGTAGLLAQSTGTTSGGMGTGTTSTDSSSTVTSSGTTTGGATTGTTSTDTSSTVTSGGTTTGGTSMGDTTTGAGNGKMRGHASPHTPNPNASETAQAVQSILQRFDANRDQLIADRKALVDQLANAQTEQERLRIMEQLRLERDDAKQQRTQLGKEVRDEIKKVREQRKAGN